MALRYVVDGNFTAQHMKMKRPEDDVSLSDGLAYMVEDGPYQLHVASAAENTEVISSLRWLKLFPLILTVRDPLVRTIGQ